MSIEITSSMVGKTIGEARQIAEHHDYMVRIVMNDGMPYVGTKDFRMDRINVSVWEGIVNSASIG